MTNSEQLSSEISRVGSVYCASCGDTLGVWTDAKHRECVDCGNIVYDDRETFEDVGKSLGGRFAVAGGRDDGE